MDAQAVLLQGGTGTPTTTAIGAAINELDVPNWFPGVVPEGVYQFVAAILLVVVAYYVSKIARQMLGRRIARRFKRPSVSRTILRTIQVAIMVVAVLTALTWVGVDFSNVALSVGVFSAVVGIVLAPIIGNVLSGVFVLSEQPYEIGDMIRLEDTQTAGFVEDITLLYTKIFTLDNTFLVMPNGAMRERDVVNFSAEDTRIRMTLDVGVTYESDIGVARDQLEAAAREVDGVIRGGPDIRIGSARYPAAPTCYMSEFGESEVLLRLRYWAKEPYKQTTVRSHVMTNVWRRFEEKDIEIPYPHSHMVFDDTSGELQVAMREATDEVATQESGATRRAERRGEGRREVSPEEEPGRDAGPAPDRGGEDGDATGSR